MPNILNNEKVFTVFLCGPVSRSTFFLRIRCVLPAVGGGLADLLVRAADITELPVVSFSVVGEFSHTLPRPVFGVNEQRWREPAKATGANEVYIKSDKETL